MITLDPKRINVSSGRTGDRRRFRAQDDAQALPKPVRASVNFIPEPESLRTLVSNAVTALRRGVRWDRGSILNLLV